MLPKRLIIEFRFFNKKDLHPSRQASAAHLNRMFPDPSLASARTKSFAQNRNSNRPNFSQAYDKP
jgi:hypothetical protein